MIDRVLKSSGDLAELRSLRAGDRLLELFAAQPRDRIRELALRALEPLNRLRPLNLRDVGPVIDVLRFHRGASDAPGDDVVPRSNVHHQLEDRMRAANGMRLCLIVGDAIEKVAQRRPVPGLAAKRAIELVE